MPACRVRMGPRPGATSCGVSLQAKIDAASAGTTIDVTGCTYSAGATVNKALTIIGCTINVAAGLKGITVTADDVTLDGLVINGPQHATFVSAEKGIYAQGTVGATIDRLTVRNCTISDLGSDGMYLRCVTALTVANNTVEDCGYTGIMVLSGVVGTITGNTVRRIGELTNVAGEYNAYGIVGTRIQGVSEPQSADFTVSGNHVSYVPNWHAMDTHAALRWTFSGNDVNYSRKGIFIVDEATDGGVSTDIVVNNNTFNNPYSPRFADVTAIWYGWVAGITITGNSGHGWGSGRDVADYQNASTGEVVSGNSFTN